MKEINAIINAYKQVEFLKNRAALVTVVKIQGSSYRRTGARMLVLDNGVYFGGISGGCLEGDALRRAQKAMYKNFASVIRYDTTEEDAHEIGVGLGCNGIIDVLITPLNNNEQDPVRLLASICETREPRVLVCIIECEGSQAICGKTVLYEDEESFISSFPVKDISLIALNDIKHALENEASQTITYNAGRGPVKVFIEVIVPAIHLIVYGSNYDILAVTNISKELGWNVTLVTHPVKAGKWLLPTGTNMIDSRSDQEPSIDNYSAVLLMAHDYKTDLNNLRKSLLTDASYIGILGPRNRSDKMFDELFEENILSAKQSPERIYAPCGLDIGAANPEEIALAITAEIKAHFAGRKGMPLKYRQGKIYSN